MKKWIPLSQVIISVIILTYLYNSLPFYEVVDVWAQADVPALVIACALALMIEVVAALRLWMLTDTQGFALSPFRLLRLNLTTRFYMLFLPGGTLASLATRFYKLQRMERRRAGALSSVLIDRTAVTVGLCFVGGLAWLIGRPPGESGAGLIVLFGLLGTILVLVGLLHPRAGHIIRAVPEVISNPTVERVCTSWLSAISLFHRMSWKAIAILAFLSILPHLFGVFIFLTLGSSFQISIDALNWGWMRTVVILATMIPISLAGLGVREVSFLILLGAHGIASENVLALAAAVFATSVLLPSLIGGILEAQGLVRGLILQLRMRSHNPGHR